MSDGRIWLVRESKRASAGPGVVEGSADTILDAIAKARELVGQVGGHLRLMLDPKQPMAWWRHPVGVLGDVHNREPHAAIAVSLTDAGADRLMIETGRKI